MTRACVITWLSNPLWIAAILYGLLFAACVIVVLRERRAYPPEPGSRAERHKAARRATRRMRRREHRMRRTFHDADWDALPGPWSPPAADDTLFLTKENHPWPR